MQEMIFKEERNAKCRVRDVNRGESSRIVRGKKLRKISRTFSRLRL